MSANHPAAFALRFLFLKRRCAVRALRSLDVDLAHAVGALLGGGSRRLLRLLRLLGKGIDSLDKEEDDECHDDEIDDGADEVAVADDSRSRLLSLSQRAYLLPSRAMNQFEKSMPLVASEIIGIKMSSTSDLTID